MRIIKQNKRFEVHTHSDCSNIRLLDSINSVEGIIKTAFDKGLSGVTLTDHEALGNHIKFLNAEKRLKEKSVVAADFKCALGNEIYLVKERKRREIKKYSHFILIAKNSIGHEALRKLSSISWSKSYNWRGMERVPTTYEELANITKEYPNSLIATTACLGGELPTLVSELIELEEGVEKENEIQEKKIQIQEFILFCKELFKEDFYIEIGCSTQKDQVNFNKRIIGISKFFNVKMVIGTDAHYLAKEERLVHKAFLTSHEGEREVDMFYSGTYLMDDEEIAEYLDYYSDSFIEELYANSQEISNKIEQFSLSQKERIPKEEVKVYPKQTFELSAEYPILDEYFNSDDVQNRYWVNECVLELKRIGKFNQEYLKRLEVEADIQQFISEKIGDTLSAYHNTMKKYVDIFWECGSIVPPGRGSACGWLSNMLLGITQIDPIKYDLPEWRYLNKERVELPDIDVDIASSRRPYVLKRIKKEKGEFGIVQICTYGTQGSRLAIQTACRGIRSKQYPTGIDTDVAGYLSSLIDQERGFLWSINDTINGNEEKNRKPNKTFISEMSKHDGLLDIVLRIEGLIDKRSSHAAGVILYNQDIWKSNAIMKSPNGDLVTQFSLYDSAEVGDTKFDFLVTETSDKIITCINLLKEYGQMPNKSLKEIYNEYLHPNVLDLSRKRMWDALASGEVLDVFQFNSDVGLQAAKAIQPESPEEMTAANSLMRLMAEKGQENPLVRYVSFKNNIQLWYDEMDKEGLTKEEQSILEKYYLEDYGTPPYQESLMRILLDKSISAFTLAEANNARRIVGKKLMDKIPDLREKFMKQCEENRGNSVLANYVWRTAIQPQLGYAFSKLHSLPYSFVAIQILFLATEYPTCFWNCACLISNSGGLDYDDEDEEEIEIIEEEEEEIEIIEEEEEEEGSPKKKKPKVVEYGKIAKAIGKIAEQGVLVKPPNINSSKPLFSPDPKTNSIFFGLRGISKIGKALIKDIVEKRPYQSVEDFQSKIKTNKPQLMNLLKSGAFDDFEDREKIVLDYVESISNKKTNLNLQNMTMLLTHNLLPTSLDLEKKIYNFNKYIKANSKGLSYNNLDSAALRFYETHFDMTLVELSNTGEEIVGKIDKKEWDKIYQKKMNPIRVYLKENQKETLDKLNAILVEEMRQKYAKGSVAKWEMDSLGYYPNEHELVSVDDGKYEFSDFYDLPEVPEVEYAFQSKEGYPIDMLKIHRICGTVLDKKKEKGTVSLLTRTGVVDLKIWKNQFIEYNKQISQKIGPNKKKVVEKSWFTRGNILVAVGIRRGDQFILKKYKNTKWQNILSLVTDITENGELKLRTERVEVDE